MVIYMSAKNIDFSVAATSTSRGCLRRMPQEVQVNQGGNTKAAGGRAAGGSTGPAKGGRKQSVHNKTKRRRPSSLGATTIAREENVMKK
jgi:hypothetical protein